MTRIFLIPLTFLLLLVTGCSQNGSSKYKAPKFKYDQNAEVQVLGEELIVPRVIRGMDIYKEYLVITYQDDITKCLVHIYDINSGKKIVSGLHIGKGPQEVIFGTGPFLNQETGILSLFDIMTKKLASVQLDSLINNKNVVTVLESEHFENASLVFPFNEEEYFICKYSTIRKPASRYVMTKGDDELYSYDEYPIEEEGLRKLIYDPDRRPVFFSPNRTKMVVGCAPGAILEIFDITNGIKKIALHYFYEPKLNNETEELDYVDSGYGFEYFKCTDKYVYGTFGGEPGSGVKFNNIAVFDWEGNPVRILRTDYQIDQICVTADDKTIYAVGVDFEGYPFILKLEIPT